MAKIHLPHQMEADCRIYGSRAFLQRWIIRWTFSPTVNSGLQPQSKLPAKPVVMIILIIGNDSKSEISDEFCAFANFLFTKKNTYDIIKLQFIIAVYLVR